VLTIAILAALAALGGSPDGQQAAAFDCSKAVLSQPKVVAEIDAGKFKGEPARLAIAQDGSIFVRWVETDRYQNELGKNFVIAPGGAMEPLSEQPPWAVQYWAWKTGFNAPGAPGLKFDVETRQQGKIATGSAGGGGAVNPNMSDPYASPVGKDMASAQNVATTTVRLKGEVVAMAENQRLVPGLTFGWAPAPYAALAYVNGRKRLAIIDGEGRKVEVQGTTDVLLPAWSPDGKKIAWLQKTGRKKFTLMEIDLR
jgi:hypothetical protein